jgi:hypothetical protein
MQRPNVISKTLHRKIKIAQHEFLCGVPGTIWLSDLSCVGHETDISLCPNNGWGTTSCVHENDIGLNCGMNI